MSADAPRGAVQGIMQRVPRLWLSGNVHGAFLVIVLALSRWKHSGYSFYTLVVTGWAYPTVLVWMQFCPLHLCTYLAVVS